MLFSKTRIHRSGQPRPKSCTKFADFDQVSVPELCLSETSWLSIRMTVEAGINRHTFGAVWASLSRRRGTEYLSRWLLLTGKGTALILDYPTGIQTSWRWRVWKAPFEI